MENPKAFIKQAWLKKHGKIPSPKIINEIILLAEKTHAREKSVDFETHLAWWNRLYINESKIVKGKFSYYHDDGSFEKEARTKRASIAITAPVKEHTHHIVHHAKTFHRSFISFLGSLLKWSALVFAGAVFAVVGLIILIKAFPLIVTDAIPVNDSDLRFAGVVIPTEDNAFYVLDAAKNKIKSPVVSADERQSRDIMLDSTVVGQDWDDTFVKDNLSYNREAIDGFYAAAKKNVFLVPIFASDSSQIDIFAKTGSLSGYAKLAKLAALDALSLVKAKKYNDGMDKAFAIVRMGYLIEHAEHGPLMQYLVGNAIKNIGLKTVQTIADTGRYTVKERKAYAADLANYTNDGTEIAAFLKGEYATMSGLLREVGAGTLLHNQNIAAGGRAIPTFAQVAVEFLQKAPSFYFYEHETRTALAETVRVYSSDAVTACGTVRPVQTYSVASEGETSSWKLLFARNALGKLLTDRFVAIAPIFKDNLCKQKELIDETVTVILSKQK